MSARPFSADVVVTPKEVKWKQAEWRRERERGGDEKPISD